MKLCSFVVDGPWGPSPRLGAVTSTRVVDLNSATRLRLESSGATATAAARIAEALCPTDVIAFACDLRDRGSPEFGVVVGERGSICD